MAFADKNMSLLLMKQLGRNHANARSSLLKRQPGYPSNISLKFYPAVSSSDRCNWEDCKTQEQELLFVVVVAVCLLAHKPTPGAQSRFLNV